jgi:hypothetical protein
MGEEIMSQRFPIPNVEFQLHDVTGGEGIYASLYDHLNKDMVDCEYYVNVSVDVAESKFVESLKENGVI